jgi:hypothetical protein
MPAVTRGKGQPKLTHGGLHLSYLSCSSAFVLVACSAKQRHLLSAAMAAAADAQWLPNRLLTPSSMGLQETHCVSLGFSKRFTSANFRVFLAFPIVQLSNR